MTTQDFLYVNDTGIRGIEATINYSEDLAGYSYTIEYENERTGISGTWTATGTWTAGVATVRYVFTTALTSGRYKCTIEIKSGTNEFNAGPFYFTVNEM